VRHDAHPSKATNPDERRIVATKETASHGASLESTWGMFLCTLSFITSNSPTLSVATITRFLVFV
jgi:hypothetical protein